MRVEADHLGSRKSNLKQSGNGQIQPVRYRAILDLAKHLRGRHLSGIANPEAKPKSELHPDSIQTSGQRAVVKTHRHHAEIRSHPRYTNRMFRFQADGEGR